MEMVYIGTTDDGDLFNVKVGSHIFVKDMERGPGLPAAEQIPIKDVVHAHGKSGPAGACYLW